MTSPHNDPESHGHKFGRVVVTVDLELRDCVIIAPQPGKITTIPRKVRFHNLDEMRGAYEAQTKLAKGGNSVAADIARALKFAGEEIQATDKRRGKR